MAELFEGEKLKLDFGTGVPVLPHDRNSINAKYVKGEVRIITEQARYPLPSVVDMYENSNAYVLNPDFQRRHKNNKAQYDYNTIVVSLYGYLERYIEDLIGEYLDQLSNRVPQFLDLPNSIQTNHLTLSLELSRKADYQKYASSVRSEDIIAKLHACFTTPNQYQLNVQAFTQHNANFRQAIVNETFTQCGIMHIGQSLRHVEPFTSFLGDEDPERDLKIYLAKNDEVVFSRLNDLASRRNDVAHGSPVADILSRDILRSDVNFIEAYADGLVAVVYEQTLPYMLKHAVMLGTPISVIDNRIVCVEFTSGEIAVGDTLIAKTQDTGHPFRGGSILEIQQNQVSLAAVNGGPGIKIGLLVEFGAKQNQEFYYCKAIR